MKDKRQAFCRLSIALPFVYHPIAVCLSSDGNEKSGMTPLWFLCSLFS